jgi:hypothetical protein
MVNIVMSYPLQTTQSHSTLTLAIWHTALEVNFKMLILADVQQLAHQLLKALDTIRAGRHLQQQLGCGYKCAKNGRVFGPSLLWSSFRHSTPRGGRPHDPREPTEVPPEHARPVVHAQPTYDDIASQAAT